MSCSCSTRRAAQARRRVRVQAAERRQDAGRPGAEQDRPRRKPKLLPLIEQAQAWHEFTAIVPVSASTGDGVERLERVLLEQLPEGGAIYPEDYLTDQPERALVAEMVREKVLKHTRDELPFSTAVVVDQFDETRSRNGFCGCTAPSWWKTSRRSRSSSAAAAR